MFYKRTSLFSKMERGFFYEFKNDTLPFVVEEVVWNIN
jgi:hypothetical protein